MHITDLFVNIWAECILDCIVDGYLVILNDFVWKRNHVLFSDTHN